MRFQPERHNPSVTIPGGPDIRMFLTGASPAVVVVCPAMKRFLSTVAISLLAIACSQSGNSKASAPPGDLAQPELKPAPANLAKAAPSTTSTKPAPSRVATRSRQPRRKKVSLARVGLDASALDRSADACTDFYRFACGGWLSKHKIPKHKARWGRLDELRQHTQRRLRTILETAAKTPPAASALMAKIGRFYRSCTNTSEVDRAGTAGIKPLVDVINKATGKASLTKAIAALHRRGVWAVFALAAAPDFKRPSRNILYLDQAGLGLPDRDYYLPGKTKYDAVRATYRSHIEKMFSLLGMNKGTARRAARDAISVESRLAVVTKTRVERRNLAGLYNRVDRAGLRKLVKNLDWKRYFAGLKHPDIDHISVTAPRFFERLNKLLTTVPKRAWRNYLKWQLLHHTSATLPRGFGKQAFRMIKTLRGTKAQPKRWQRCVAATNRAMPDAVAQTFVAKHFSAASRRHALGLVKAIGAAFDRSLDEVSWMHDTTKAAAKKKRGQMRYQIGYPGKWRTSPAAVTDNFAANTLAARAVHIQRELDRVGKAVDRKRWTMAPTTVNASYNPLHNRMTFPAGILQAPYFSRKHTTPVNLGAMGMIVGHELTHGFDDSGARFDGSGKLANWWHKSDARKFVRKARCVVKQFNRYKPVRGERINGRLTLGENIADLGGIKLAFKAYRKLAKKAPTTYTAGGFTEDQQFFLAVAQSWCSKTRKAELRRRLLVDPHAPRRFRVNGALSNVPEFAKAFQCKPGSKMRRKKICRIW